MAAATLAIGLRPLTDNSFFTHLATGRFILEQGSVPSTDPYTFTAHGEPWVVQSWLASWLYATAEAIGGATALRLLVAAVTLTVVLVAWRLTLPASSLLARLALAALFVGSSAGLWAERPFMFGLIAIGLVVLFADGALDPRFGLLVGWLWANLHGSFPLAFVYLAVVALGSRLDGRPVRPPLRAGAFLGVGVLSGVIGPLGPKLLSFPLQVVQRQSVLQNVIEWRAPTFTSFSQRAFLVLVALAIVSLVRKPSYRSGLVVATFGVLGMMSMRNLPIASLAFLPIIASAAPELGRLRSSDRTPLAGVFAAAAVVLGVSLCVQRLSEPDFELGRYPVDALAYLQATEVDPELVPLVAPDIVGNTRELIEGATGTIYYDDRFDMFPKAVSEQHLDLVRATVGSRAALEASGASLVLWQRTSPLSQRLISDADWRLMYSDERWVVLCRRSATLGGGRSC